MKMIITDNLFQYLRIPCVCDSYVTKMITYIVDYPSTIVFFDIKILLWFYRVSYFRGNKLFWLLMKLASFSSSGKHDSFPSFSYFVSVCGCIFSAKELSLCKCQRYRNPQIYLQTVILATEQNMIQTEYKQLEIETVMLNLQSDITILLIHLYFIYHLSGHFITSSSIFRRSKSFSRKIQSSSRYALILIHIYSQLYHFSFFDIVFVARTYSFIKLLKIKKEFSFLVTIQYIRLIGLIFVYFHSLPETRGEISLYTVVLHGYRAFYFTYKVFSLSFSSLIFLPLALSFSFFFSLYLFLFLKQKANLLIRISFILKSSIYMSQRFTLWKSWEEKWNRNEDFTARIVPLDHVYRVSRFTTRDVFINAKNKRRYTFNVFVLVSFHELNLSSRFVEYRVFNITNIWFDVYRWKRIVQSIKIEQVFGNKPTDFYERNERK